jgi:hypothetical protein
MYDEYNYVLVKTVARAGTGAITAQPGNTN